MPKSNPLIQFPKKALTNEQMKTLLNLLHRRKMFVEQKLYKEQCSEQDKIKKEFTNQPTIKKAIKEASKAAKNFKTKLTILKNKKIGNDDNYLINDIASYINSKNKHFINTNHPQIQAISNKFKEKKDKLQDLALEVEMNIVGLEISFTQAVKIIDSKLTQVLQ